MEPDEKRFWVGITVFATLFGGGMYVVFDHAAWGWIFMVAGIGGLVIGIVERAKNVRQSPAMWLVAILATWALIGYDVYDRRAFDTGKMPLESPLAPLTDEQTRIVSHLRNMQGGWGAFGYQEIANRTFSGETILIDGRKFVNCNFTNVTWVYEGTGPFEFINSTMYGKETFQSDIPMLRNVMDGLVTLSLVTGVSSFPQVITKPHMPK